MSAFSGKKKYYAYAASSSLFTKEEFPDTFKSELLQHSIGRENSMAQVIQQTIYTDVFARAKSMFKYAGWGEDPTHEGGYIRGLPSSNMELVTVSTASIEMALTAAVGAYDSILSTASGVYDEFFFVNLLIQDAWGTHWDETQETIEIPIINPDTGLNYEIDNLPLFIRSSTSTIDIAPEDLRDILGSDGYSTFPLTDAFDGHYNVEWAYTDNLGATAYYVLEDLDISPYMAADQIMVKYYIGTELFY